MLLFSKAESFTREELLRRAEDFRSRRKPKKAIAQLEKLLRVMPDDAVAHAKLGPLLVKVGRKHEALHSFRVAADDFDARGFTDKALSLWLLIAQTQADNLDAWQKVAQFHAARGHKPDAVKVLLQAVAAQQGKAGRPRAISLLRDVLVLDSKHLDATLSLARLLKKAGEKAEARSLLHEALTFTVGPSRRRVRKLEFSLFPSFGTFWRWARAL